MFLGTGVDRLLYQDLQLDKHFRDLSRGNCWFGIILCLSHYFVPLLTQKLLCSGKFEEDMKQTS